MQVYSSPLGLLIPSHPLTFSATLGTNAGNDIVEGLQESLTAKTATIKPGEDIPLNVTPTSPTPQTPNPRRTIRRPPPTHLHLAR